MTSLTTSFLFGAALSSFFSRTAHALGNKKWTSARRPTQSSVQWNLINLNFKQHRILLVAAIVLLSFRPGSIAFLSQPQRHQYNKVHFHFTPWFSKNNDNVEEEEKKEKTGLSTARVRFSGLELDKGAAVSNGTISRTGSTQLATTTNPLDQALTLLTSDVASVGLGLVGLCLLLIERLMLPDAASQGQSPGEYAEQLGEETRSNLIAVFACGSVLLNGISKLDVTSALAEAVELDGTLISEPRLWYDPLERLHQYSSTLQWGMKSLLQATPARTVVILRSNNMESPWNIVGVSGMLPATLASTAVASQPPPELASATPILDRLRKRQAASSSDNNNQETYLPTLQALPGKTEFTYLPTNTQGVLILSVPPSSGRSKTTTTAVVLGTNRAKSFTPRDVAWCQTLVARLFK